MTGRTRVFVGRRIPDEGLRLDDCLVVPHIASASHATRARMAEMAAATLLAGLRGDRLPTSVDRQPGGRS
jgi:lactate dehydrogenase-like 2-hydroxyacid dehydrogenase